MRRWLFPLMLGLVLAFAGYHFALAQFPRVLMSLASHRIAKGAGFNAMFAAPLATALDRRPVMSASGGSSKSS